MPARNKVQRNLLMGTYKRPNFWRMVETAVANMPVRSYDRKIFVFGFLLGVKRAYYNNQSWFFPFTNYTKKQAKLIRYYSGTNGAFLARLALVNKGIKLNGREASQIKKQLQDRKTSK